MDLQTGERGRSPILKRNQLITVDYYKLDDEDAIDWIEENTDRGMAVKCVDYNDESDLLWIEGCPFAIPSWVCYKD